MRGMRLLAATAFAGLVAFSAAAEAKETLRLMTVFDAPTVQLWEPVLAAYNEANPDYEVKMETVAGSGAAVYPDVLRTAMASGDPPDVFFMWGGSGAVTSRTPPDGLGSTRRRARRCSLRSTSDGMARIGSVRRGSFGAMLP